MLNGTQTTVLNVVTSEKNKEEIQKTKCSATLTTTTTNSTKTTYKKNTFT